MDEKNKKIIDILVDVGIKRCIYDEYNILIYINDILVATYMHEEELIYTTLFNVKEMISLSYFVKLIKLQAFL